MWFLKISLAVVIIMVVALAANLIMVLLTFTAWKLNMTFYQAALIFAGVVALLGLAGLFYRKVYERA